MLYKAVVILICLISQTSSQKIFDLSELKADIVLESNYKGFGMVGQQGDHLYLRIYNDGKVEYETEKELDGTIVYSLTKKQVSDKELQDIVNFLNSNEMGEIGNNISLNKSGVDYSVKLFIRFNNKFKRKLKFEYFESMLKKDTPGNITLLKLLCAVENIRTNANYSVVYKPDSLCK